MIKLNRKALQNLSYVLIFGFFFFTFVAYADSNGIWHEAGDVRGGIFGSDESGFDSLYAFVSPVIFRDNVTIETTANCSLVTDSSGQIGCGGTDLRSKICDPGEFLRGFDEDGSPVCDTVFIYSWQAQDWGECSATCGGGTKTRDILCLRNDNEISDESFCIGTKPEETTTCNMQACELSLAEVDSQNFGVIKSGYIDTDNPQSWSAPSMSFQRDISDVKYLEAKPYFYIANNYQYLTGNFYIRYRIQEDGSWGGWSSYKHVGGFGGQWIGSRTVTGTIVLFDNAQAYSSGTRIEIQYYAAGGTVSGRGGYTLGGGYYKTLDWYQR